MFCRNCGKDIQDGMDLPANRKEMPVKGSFSIFPFFGIMGVKLMVISLMVSLYSYNQIDAEQGFSDIAMSIGIACALLSVLFGLAGVFRNIKAPVEGRGLFLFSCFFSLTTTVLTYIACSAINFVNAVLIVITTSSAIAFIMLLIESQRIMTIKTSYYKQPYRRRHTGIKRNKDIGDELTQNKAIQS